MLEVGQHSNLQRLDNFLLAHLKGVPKSHIYRVIRKGEVRVNKKRAKPDNKLRTGDIVRVPPIRVAETRAAPVPSQGLIELLQAAVLFEDEQMLVINKPQGLAVHMGSGLQIGLIEALRWMRTRDDEGAFLELAHRIDKDTTGCVVIAKNPIFLKYLHSEFKVRNVRKIYQAIVHGKWDKDVVEVNAPLLKHDIEGSEKIVTVSREGKSALTHFKLLEHFEHASFIEASPLTGRTHQIRVHCQYAGHPIVGDMKYTSNTQTPLTRFKNLCLHAASIEFTLPDGKSMRVEAPLGASTLDLLGKLRRNSRQFS